MVGAEEVAGGSGGIGAGVAVRATVAEGSALSFPANFALLYALATFMMLASAVAPPLLPTRRPL